MNNKRSIALTVSAFLVGFLSLGCSGGGNGNQGQPDSGADTGQNQDGAVDAGADAGGDIDTDGDTDGDTDTDSDSDTDSDGDADATADAAPDATPDGGDADADTDSDSDTDTDADADADADSWYDPTSGLTWQNVPAGPMTWQDAVNYCNGLSLAGHNDWYLPRIQELISLIRGCDQSGCGISDPGCLDLSCADGCSTCSYLAGPGSGGCYWDPALEGPCDWYWSSSSYAYDTSCAWLVYFHSGRVSYYDKTYAIYVRCVRLGP